MQVQWYPGHMTKAKRMMQEDIKLVDLVIELIDARIPFSSGNPDIDELARGKSRLILLNKADLADQAMNAKWQEYFKEKGLETLIINSRSREGFSPINRSIEKVCSEKIERDRKKGIIGRPVRAMVVGIPNVGKSTFINSLCRKASAKTGNKPGVTKGKQWIKLDKGVDLLDTPGILWPRFENEKIGLNLAYIGSINDEILDETELAMNLISNVKTDYPGVFFDRYGCDESKETAVILEEISVKRGCLKKGNEPDTGKGAHIVLDEFRSGKLGHITLETPDQI